MTPEESQKAADRAYAGGFVSGLLTARYYALRHPLTASLYSKPVPSETPDIVYGLLTTMLRKSVDNYLFGRSWDSLDHLLLCETQDALMAEIAATRPLPLIADTSLLVAQPN